MGVQVKKMLIWLLRRWKWVLWVLAVLVSLGIFHGMCRGDQKTETTLTAQTAWQRWETEDKPYAQASVYLPEDSAISAAELSGIRLSMENTLTAAGVPSTEHPWFYAASRTEQVTLQNGIASSTVELSMITGDYFRIPSHGAAHRLVYVRGRCDA